jgi:hypothetical protein
MILRRTPTDDVPEPAIDQWLAYAHPAQVELIDLQRRTALALAGIDRHLAGSNSRPAKRDALLDLRLLLTGATA